MPGTELCCDPAMFKLFVYLPLTVVGILLFTGCDFFGHR